MKEQRKRIDRAMVKRMSIIGACAAAAALALVVRLWIVQVKDHNYYKTESQRQMTVATEVSSDRGTIYDRNGSVLAANATNYYVCISPYHINIYKDKAAEATKVDEESGEESPLFDAPLDEFIARELSDILEVEESKIFELMAKVNRQYEVVKKEVDEDTAQLIRGLIEEYGIEQQIYLRANIYRTYPYSTLASQVIGFVNSEGNGALGLEAFYNNLLVGTTGKYISAQDAHSNEMPFEYESFIDPESGYSIETTLDVYIQHELENQLKATYEENLPNERVTGIVMNVNTGDILGMATYPPYDLNDPRVLDEYSMAKYEAEIELCKADFDLTTEEGRKAYETKCGEIKTNLLYNMWSNKAVNQLYEPGSTFKVMTSCMGFEEDVITETTGFYCAGSLKVDGYSKPIGCHYRAGHGAVSFAEGLQQSCNPVFIQVSQRLGTTNFYKYFNSFGYTERTGIDLPGEAWGITASEKNFTPASLVIYSFGQTFKTTPIQQIRAISSVANGGYLVTPHLLKSIKDSDGNVVAEYEAETLRQVVSESVCERVTKILEEGVSGNGGAKNAYVKGYKVAAKTGTSEKRDLIAQNGDQPYYRVGSTVAYAPADDPEVAVLIVVDEPTQGVVYGSRVAAPYVSNLLSYVLPYLGYEAQYTDKDLEKKEITVPDLEGLTVEAAKSDLQWRELACEVVGDGDTVTGQLPAKNSSVSQSSGRVILYTGGETPKADVRVPDLIGKTAEVANRLLVNSGLNIDFEGAAGHQEGAIVVSQSPAADSTVPKGTVVTIELRYTDSSD